MRGFIIWFCGLAPGIVLGYLLRIITSKVGRKQCRFVRDDGSSFHNCRGVSSNICVERLCPAHCKEVHQEKCLKQMYQR